MTTNAALSVLLSALFFLSLPPPPAPQAVALASASVLEASFGTSVTGEAEADFPSAEDIT
jgi:hypothetical protein